MAKKTGKISYGKKDVLTADDFKNPKIRISMMVDEDVIRAFKERAKETGEGYQTLMHRALRDASLRPSVEERLAKLESLVTKAS
jgi:uncharacterized protein (DUF4415 family)